MRVQYHLRQHPACLERCAHVVPPLALPAVYEAEAQDRARDKARKRGAWQTHTAAQPPLPFFGPLLPTSDEALLGLLESEITLERIQTLYRPSKQVLEWVRGTLSRRSREGLAQGPMSFG